MVRGLPPKTSVGSWENAHLHDHLNGGQCGAEVLGVRGSHCDRYTAAVQAAIEGSDEIHPWGDAADGHHRAQHVGTHVQVR